MQTFRSKSSRARCGSRRQGAANCRAKRWRDDYCQEDAQGDHEDLEATGSSWDCMAEGHGRYEQARHTTVGFNGHSSPDQALMPGNPDACLDSSSLPLTSMCSGTDSDDDDSSLQGDVLVELARWIRWQQRARLLDSKVQSQWLSTSQIGSQTKLLQFLKTELGVDFLREQERQSVALIQEISAATNATSASALSRAKLARAHAYLSRIHELRGCVPQATEQLEQAIACVKEGSCSCEGVASDSAPSWGDPPSKRHSAAQASAPPQHSRPFWPGGSGGEHCPVYATVLHPLDHRTDALLTAAASTARGSLLRRLAAERVRLLRQERVEMHISRVGSAASSPRPQGAGRLLCVAREKASELSAERFHQRYAAPGRPVVIEGGAYRPSADWGSLAHLRTVLGQHRAETRQLVPGSTVWAALEECPGQLTVAEFLDQLDGLSDQADCGGQTPSYLFDWSLPQHSPELLRELRIPKYFCNDFLQRCAPASLYRESWPSLFIGPRGSACGLHVDTAGSNFWMLLLAGRKRWTIYPRECAAALAPSFVQGHDAAFDAGRALSAADRYEFDLSPGELLFVPAGSPHTVTNLEHTSAISANYIDESNLDLALTELRVAALSNPEAAALHSQLACLPTERACMNFTLGDLSWHEFKGQHETLYDTVAISA